jgi:hypothetical protein
MMPPVKISHGVRGVMNSFLFYRRSFPGELPSAGANKSPTRFSVGAEVA